MIWHGDGAGLLGAKAADGPVFGAQIVLLAEGPDMYSMIVAQWYQPSRFLRSIQYSAAAAYFENCSDGGGGGGSGDRCAKVPVLVAAELHGRRIAAAEAAAVVVVVVGGTSCITDQPGNGGRSSGEYGR